MKTKIQRWWWSVLTILVISCTPIFANVGNSTRVIKANWLGSSSSTGPPVIDGDLSEAVWHQIVHGEDAAQGRRGGVPLTVHGKDAAHMVACDFVRAKQTGGVPAKLKTEAMVLYDEDTLYIGMLCEEPNMNALRETQTRRDSAVWQDDTVQVQLDTYNDQRNCYVLAVNTLGTQMDAKISNEGGYDENWNANWEAKVQKNGDHWTAEMAIPFRELRFNPRQTEWGINFWRRHPMDQERYSWSDTKGSFSRVSDFGKLTNLNFSQVNTARKIGILPYMTQRSVKGQDVAFNKGLDLIIPVSTNITTNLTFSPDFSQLESDSTQINISSDREMFLPERRPFFREGAELFDLPLDLYYSRRVQEIDYGVKSTGRVGDYNFALINTYGQVVDRYDGNEKKQANLLASRVNRNIGERTVIGAMGVQKHQDDRDVTLLSLDSRLALHRDWTARGQYVVNSINGNPMGETPNNGTHGNGIHHAYHTSINWHGQSGWQNGWNGSVRLEEIQDGFRPNETGYEDEAFRKTYSRLGYGRRLAEGRRIQSFSVSGYHFHKTNAQGLLWVRRIGLSSSVDIGRFDITTYGGFGAQRDKGRLFDRRYVGSRISYRSKWGGINLFNRVGEIQEQFSRYSSFSVNANLFSKLTVNFGLRNFFWRTHQNTLIFRLRSNYQFTPRLGWRIFVERVDRRLQEEVSYNFNSVFDYQFTPESRLYFVFVDNSKGERAVLTKMSYLFETGTPF
jgi:hypothetical protein